MNGRSVLCRQAGAIGDGGNRRGRQRQRGAIAVVFVLLLVVLVGVLGLSLDISRLYNRKVELQSLADAAALSGADKLNGTVAGINAAVLSAKAAGMAKKFSYERSTASWSEAAVKFSTAPSGAEWVSAAVASANPVPMMYIKVDTDELADATGTIDTIFMRVLAPESSTAYTRAAAVAGRSHVKVTPLAVCALSGIVGNSRASACDKLNPELIQYGFRRGVGYDLMQLNPHGPAPVNFVINPIDRLETKSAANLEAGVVGPWVCSGTLPFGNVVGGPVAIGRGFPIGDLFQQLNSRFDHNSPCDKATAPPDVNVKPFVFSTAGWMVQTPEAQTAKKDTTLGLRTVADPNPTAPSTTAPQYGLLWSYAKPVRYCNTAGGTKPEPYTQFDQSMWPVLFAPTDPGPTPNANYPATTPYLDQGGSTFEAPTSGPGVAKRRVLHVPLLSCPVPSGASTATVLAIGRFFMTVPATPTSVMAEFAGIEPQPGLLSTVELYR